MFRVLARLKRLRRGCWLDNRRTHAAFEVFCRRHSRLTLSLLPQNHSRATLKWHLSIFIIYELISGVEILGVAGSHATCNNEITIAHLQGMCYWEG